MVSELHGKTNQERRETARACGQNTYRSLRRCPLDGTRIRFVATNNCVDCVLYKRAIKAGRIDGIDGRKLHEKSMANAHYESPQDKKRTD
jgi:hypothetical protein